MKLRKEAFFIQRLVHLWLTKCLEQTVALNHCCDVCFLICSFPDGFIPKHTKMGPCIRSRGGFPRQPVYHRFFGGACHLLG